MALFGNKKTTEQTDANEAVSKNVAKKSAEKNTAKKPASKKTLKPSVSHNPHRVLLKPRITEKASWATVKNVFVFEVPQDVTKSDIIEAIEVQYNITPKKVNVVRMKSQNVLKRMRGQRGKTAGMKKAYVFLKKGDRIELA